MRRFVKSWEVYGIPAKEVNDKLRGHLEEWGRGENRWKHLCAGLLTPRLEDAFLIWEAQPTPDPAGERFWPLSAVRDMIFNKRYAYLERQSELCHQEFVFDDEQLEAMFESWNEVGRHGSREAAERYHEENRARQRKLQQVRRGEVDGMYEEAKKLYQAWLTPF